jgi:hypothetical protein
MKSLKKSHVLIVVMIALLFEFSCNSEEPEIFCQSDTLRYIVSKNVKLKITYDSIGRVSEFEPLSSEAPFKFRDITVSERLVLRYDSLGRILSIRGQSSDYLTFSYYQNGIIQSGQSETLYCSLDSVGRIISQSRRIKRNDSYYQYIPVRTLFYFQDNVTRLDIGAQDFNDLRRIWVSSSFTIDNRVNPLYNTLSVLSLTSDPILLSKNNSTSASVIYSLRNQVPLGTKTNELKYDRMGKLIYFKSGENLGDELYFSYCKE